ncbi:hypothetical protein GFL88_06050 [Rhizobium leguminosarum bv. viciae]|nr:hypothetical protein [Rhizobium leguminosarum bv. viciae]
MICITAPRVFQTRKGRCNTLDRRIVLSENRFRFSGRCGSDCRLYLCRRCHDATSADELTLLAYLNISMRLNTSAPVPS